MPGKPTSRRAAATAGGGARSAEAPANTGSHLRRGAAAAQQAADEAQQAAERRASGGDVWRLWLADDASVRPGTECEGYPEGIPKNLADIIILDATLEDIVGQHEHNLKIAGRYGNFETCPKEFDHCAVCDNGDQGYYILFLSILALIPWTSKKGDKSGSYTKMLLAVKAGQFAELQEVLHNAQQSNNGVLRGTYLHMKRTVNDSNASNIGIPRALDGGMLFDHYSEEELISEFGHVASMSNEGKVMKEENQDIMPYDYNKLFPKPDAEAIRRRHGGKAQPGSAAEASEAWGAGEPEQTAQRTAPRRRPPPAPTPAEEEDDLPFDQGAQQPDAADPFANEQG